MIRLLKKEKFRFVIKSWYDYYVYLGFLYHNLFFCSLIKEGKKLKAFNFLLSLKFNLKLKESFDPFNIILIAFMNVSPEIIVRYFRSGAIKHGIGLPISDRKKIAFAIKWTVKLLREKQRVVTIDNLTEIILNSLFKRSESFKMKTSFYKLAVNNRFLIRKYYK